MKTNNLQKEFLRVQKLLDSIPIKKWSAPFNKFSLSNLFSEFSHLYNADHGFLLFRNPNLEEISKKLSDHVSSWYTKSVFFSPDFIYCDDDEDRIQYLTNRINIECNKFFTSIIQLIKDFNVILSDIFLELKEINDSAYDVVEQTRNRNKLELERIGLEVLNNISGNTITDAFISFDIGHLPRGSGVYYLICDNEIVYIGKAKDLYQRMKHHHIYKEQYTIAYILIDDKVDRINFERSEILRLKPCFNKQFFEPTYSLK